MVITEVRASACRCRRFPIGWFDLNPVYVWVSVYACWIGDVDDCHNVLCVCVCARVRERERERGLVSYVQFSFVEAATSVLFRATWYHRFADSEKLKLVL